MFDKTVAAICCPV